MAQLLGQLTLAVEPVGALLDEVCIAKDLPHLGQVRHVRVVEAVIVSFIFVENGLCQFEKLVLFDLVVFVLSDQEPDSIDLIAEDGCGDDRSQAE